MSLHRRAAARDGNEPAIVEALEAVGAHVTRMAEPVDLLVGFRGQTYLLEVKLPRGPKGGEDGRTLTDAQVRFFNAWTGGMLAVVRSPDEACRAIGVMVDSGDGS
jgi:hypothetical protein